MLVPFNKEPTGYLSRCSQIYLTKVYVFVLRRTGDVVFDTFLQNGYDFYPEKNAQPVVSDYCSIGLKVLNIFYTCAVVRLSYLCEQSFTQIIVQ